MVPEAWLEIGLSDLVTFLKALMDHDKHWAFGILEALMRVGVERFRFGCFGPAKLTLTIDQHQSIKEIITTFGTCSVYLVRATLFREDGEMVGSRWQ